jgi:hypothetical protein
VTYLHLPEARSVAGSHILVESVDSGNTGHLTVLLVHVVGAGARVVADPDAEVLDLLGALLVDLRVVSVQARFVLLAQDVLHPARPVARTWFTETISPFAFLILRSLPRKYQNRDLATTSLGAKMRIR